MFTQRTDWIVLAAVSLMLAGCADYMSQRDSVTLGAGNALEANIGLHTVNPFPRRANNTRIDVDGRSAVLAQERYLTPGDPDVVSNAVSPTAGGIGSAE
ncbi:MAG: hypothetical protein JJ866_11935 [Roseibium sp.]|uniref:hypothetical protein n=1 Tax=Roseibium sp. TaxID=1936156 RepID=UPI001B24B7A0|nr:hypothetical protein [Roseibium sp.]MBO6509397.1 hypothetical protein [Roseibium sp.]MBO6892643.1 hypothetical protein [Roseibium sp.]MBO6928227.1 hypothetical protein [Roseibium sp.]